MAEPISSRPPQQLRKSLRLDSVGFCGLDDSADLHEAANLSQVYPWIEWGVLLRPDKQGQPRYASDELLGRIARCTGAACTSTTPSAFRLAVHLCGHSCLRALSGDVDFVRSLHSQLGFRRVQLNPTEANAAGGWDPVEAAAGIRTVAAALPDIELILQVNDETRCLFTHLFGTEDETTCEDEERGRGDMPPWKKRRTATGGMQPKREVIPNIAVLLDPSCGLGIAPQHRELPPEVPGLHVGYAGGFGPEKIIEQLDDLAELCAGYDSPVWIDMESSLRSKLGGCMDIFDLTRVRAVIEAVHAAGYVPSK